MGIGVDLVSGATGFVGRRLLEALKQEGRACRGMVRCAVPPPNCVVADLADRKALALASLGVERVFHCAGHAHAFSSLSADEAQQHWQINFEGTRNLAEAAGEAGAKCFVFLSSVKAMAEPGVGCVDEDCPGEPETAYGQAKRAAEEAVLAAGRRYGMHVVNLRLAMVYGAGGRGNLERMGRLVKKGFFPPLPETGNHRSLVHVDDVVSAIRVVAADPRAGGNSYIVAGQEAPSGRDLFNAMRKAQGMPPCHWSVPLSLLRTVAFAGDKFEAWSGCRLPFNGEVLARLTESAWYSPAKIERDLAWRARISLSDGLIEMFEK